MFWKRRPAVETSIDLASLCAAAAWAVDEIHRIEAENAHLKEAIESRTAALNAALAQRDRLADELIEAKAATDRAIERHIEAENRSSSAQWKYMRARDRAAAMMKERDAAIAEVDRLMTAYDDLAGGLALMTGVAMDVLETFPPEEPDSGDADFEPMGPEPMDSDEPSRAE